MTPTAMKKSDKKRTAPGKKPPFFSVVLPLHPQKSYVQKSLDSILARSEERRVGSDWSSDVCSSDLKIGQEKNGSREKTALFLGRPPLAPPKKLCAKIPGFDPGQIGRASCRE